MRRVTALMLMLMSLSSLAAQTEVRSNSIGQDRGKFAQESEYTLTVQEGESTLYHQGKAVWRESRTPLQGGFEVLTYLFEDGSTQHRRYVNNRLVSESTGPEVRYYYYDDLGILEKTIVLLSGEIVEMEIYTYDVNTRSLSSILSVTAEGSSISYFGDPMVRPWFSYTTGETFTKVVQISDNLQIQEVWQGDTQLKSVTVEMPPEGGIRLTTKRKGYEESELYNDEALLVLRTNPFLTTEYRYNEERSLSEVIEKAPDGQKRVIRYEDGREVSEELYLQERLEKKTLYPIGSGKVETLYDNAQPYCDITYALDGKRVLSIRYL